MVGRLSVRAFVLAILLAVLIVPFSGCGSSTTIDAVTISPATVTLGPDATVQLTALGTIGHGAHPSGHQDVTTLVKWASSISGVASVSASGLVTGHNAGVTTITASIQGFQGLITSNTATITVPAPTGPLVSLAVDPTTQSASAAGQTAQFLAIGTTNTGATQNLTNVSQWTSSDSSVATVNAATGLATAVGNGTATITAVASNPDGSVVSGSATYTVKTSSSGSSEPLVSLAITPATGTASAVNQTTQFLAIGTTASGTTVNLTNQTANVSGAIVSAAVWSSSNSSTAKINSATGLATATGAGVSAITAIATNPDGSVVTGTATYTVTIPNAPEPLVSMAILPGSQAASAAGQTANFIAIGTTSSGTTVNLTNQSATVGSATISAAKWTSSSPSTATVNSATGVATAATAGVTAITAIATNPDGSVVTAAATYTVTIPTAPEPLVSLAIVPASQTATVAKQTAQFIAIGTTATGTTVNLTNQPATINGKTVSPATWTSSVSSVATIGASSGLATAVNSGVTAIIAIAYNPDGTAVTGTATYTVNVSGAQEPLLSLAIVPNAQSVQYPGQTSQLLAIGTFSAAPTTQNLTDNNTTYPIRWQSSDTSVATVGSPEQAGTTPGLVTAVGQGVASITAYAANPDGTLVYAIDTFNVVGGTAEPFTSITISPSAETLSATGQTGQLLATATTGTTGLTQDVTNSPQVKWSSSIPTIATVSTSPTTPAGQVAGVSPGTTQITAELTNPADGTVLTSTATITVTASSQAEPLLSITILPTSVSTGNLYGTGQFLAYGTFSTPPTVQDITNGISRKGFTSPVYWISDLQTEFPVTTASGPFTYPPSTPLTDGGLVTAYASGSTSLYVTATNPDGTLVYSPAVTFACPYQAPTTTDVGSCNPETIANPLLVTLTVFNAGLNPNVTGNWLVTAPSATGTPAVIHCGPGSAVAGYGDSVCSAPYPIGATVTLTTVTATNGTAAGDGVAFGGWSYNCNNNINPPPTPTAEGTNTCTVLLGNDTSATNPTSNVSVGAIFNNAN